MFSGCLRLLAMGRHYRLQGKMGNVGGICHRHRGFLLPLPLYSPPHPFTGLGYVYMEDLIQLSIPRAPAGGLQKSLPCPAPLSSQSSHLGGSSGSSSRPSIYGIHLAGLTSWFSHRVRSSCLLTPPFQAQHPISI